jgi:hypothetical protein
VDPKAGLDTGVRGKIIFTSAGDQTPNARPPSPQSDTIPTELQYSVSTVLSGLVFVFYFHNNVHESDANVYYEYL